VFDSTGQIEEWDKYRAYGVPFLLTPGDHNKDGAVAKDDSNAFDADYAAGNLRADLNKSGTVTTADQTIFNASYAKAVVGGRWKLSAPDIANRKGYAGYEHDGGLPELAHVRNRVLHFGLGRWTRRDPAGYVDGANILAVARSAPLTYGDSFGLLVFRVGGCKSTGTRRLRDPAWTFGLHETVHASVEFSPLRPPPTYICAAGDADLLTCFDCCAEEGVNWGDAWHQACRTDCYAATPPSGCHTHNFSWDDCVACCFMYFDVAESWWTVACLDACNAGYPDFRPPAQIPQRRPQRPWPRPFWPVNVPVFPITV